MPAPGETFGRYHLEHELGRGGMGQVFAATDTVLKRRVAVKPLLDTRTEDGPARARLLREAQAAAALDHPNAVRVYDAGEHEGTPFLAMQYVEGETLRARLQRGATQAEVLRWLGQVASALGAAHDLGIIHRDIKPDNVMIRPDGRALVLDFGIARRAPGANDPTGMAELLSLLKTGSIEGTLTKTGALMGTPMYMAPEQLTGGRIDARTDQFS